MVTFQRADRGLFLPVAASDSIQFLMNLNRLLALVGLMLLTSGLAATAYGLRYVPIGGTAMQTVTMWDRWERRVCAVTMVRDGKRLDCSLDELSR